MTRKARGNYLLAMRSDCVDLATLRYQRNPSSPVLAARRLHHNLIYVQTTTRCLILSLPGVVELSSRGALRGALLTPTARRLLPALPRAFTLCTSTPTPPVSPSLSTARRTSYILPPNASDNVMRLLRLGAHVAQRLAAGILGGRYTDRPVLGHDERRLIQEHSSIARRLCTATLEDKALFVGIDRTQHPASSRRRRVGVPDRNAAPSTATKRTRS